MLEVGGDGGFERTLSGDIRCSSPDELVPSDCVSEPWFEKKTLVSIAGIRILSCPSIINIKFITNDISNLGIDSVNISQYSK